MRGCDVVWSYDSLLSKQVEGGLCRSSVVEVRSEGRRLGEVWCMRAVLTVALSPDQPIVLAARQVRHASGTCKEVSTGDFRKRQLMYTYVGEVVEVLSSARRRRCKDAQAVIKGTVFLSLI